MAFERGIFRLSAYSSIRAVSSSGDRNVRTGSFPVAGRPFLLGVTFSVDAMVKGDTHNAERRKGPNPRAAPNRQPIPRRSILASTTLGADSARANALHDIEKLADEIRTALRRIHSLAGAIDDASNVLERYAGELSKQHCKEHIEASERIYNYRALIEDLTDPAVEQADEIERLCSQLKWGDEPTQPQDHRVDVIAAAQRRGLDEARSNSSWGESR